MCSRWMADHEAPNLAALLVLELPPQSYRSRHLTMDASLGVHDQPSG
jgi:hypothetical protein